MFHCKGFLLILILLTFDVIILKFRVDVVDVGKRHFSFSVSCDVPSFVEVMGVILFCFEPNLDRLVNDEIVEGIGFDDRFSIGLWSFVLFALKG